MAETAAKVLTTEQVEFDTTAFYIPTEVITEDEASFIHDEIENLGTDVYYLGPDDDVWGAGKNGEHTFIVITDNQLPSSEEILTHINKALKYFAASKEN